MTSEWKPNCKLDSEMINRDSEMIFEKRFDIMI